MHNNSNNYNKNVVLEFFLNFFFTITRAFKFVFFRKFFFFLRKPSRIRVGRQMSTDETTVPFALSFRSRTIRVAKLHTLLYNVVNNTRARSYSYVATARQRPVSISYLRRIIFRHKTI